MTITRQPESLCLTGNMASIRVATDTDITMTLTSGGDELLTHTYSPTADNIVDINLRDVITSLLSCQLSNTSSPYQQTMICRQFTVTLTDGTDTETVSFKALRAGVDNLSDTVGNFLQHNFLTWQPNVKPVTYYTPEFLTYYAQQQVVVKCLAHIAEGNETTVTLATISADTCVTIPVQYAIIAGLTNALPQWYDVWVETGGGTRLTYKQRYYAQDMRSEQEQWILFENSLGGIDTFRAYGDSDNTAEHTHNVAEIEEVSQEYRVDTERKYKKSTGRLDRNERLWLLDFFPSTRKYIYIGQSLRQIVVVESDVNYKASELPSSYTFTYRYADAKPYLNLPRTDVPLEVLDIQVPDVGSFTVAPRLVEFPSTPLDDGALFPVQDPYSEEWGTTTFGAIRQIIAAMVSTAEESFAVLTHTHLNKSFLDGLSWDSIRNHFAGYFLSKTNADTAQGLITFAAGLVSNAIAWFKQGIKIGSDANSPLGIDANGNAKLNSVTSDDIHSDGYSDDTLAGSGYHVYKDANGNGHVCTDILDVRMKARFAELEIRKLSYINAEQVQSEAASKLEIVLPVAASGTVLNGTFSESNVAAYRCMVLADDGTMATKNGWKLGDQARCQTFNITASGDYTNIESRLYWRLVVRIGQCMDDGTIITQQTDLTDYTGKIHHFFDLANLADLTCDPTTRTPNEGAEFAEFFSDTLTTGNAYHGMMTQNYNSASADDLAVMATQEWNDVPAADDDVVQMGSQTDETRMGFFVTKADGLNTGPYIYAGVNNFSLVGKMITKITPQEVLISARKLQVFSDPNAGDASPLTHYRGDWAPVNGVNPTSYYYDEWDYQSSRWLCLYQGAEGTTEAPGTTPANWKEISLKGDSVKIAGYAEYYYGETSPSKQMPDRPNGEDQIALLNYPTRPFMIYASVLEDFDTLTYEWEGRNVPYGTCYIYRVNNHLYQATRNGWQDLGRFKGEDGTSVSYDSEHSSLQYAVSQYGTAGSGRQYPSDISSWQNAMPAVQKGKYLWTKDTTAYNNGGTIVYDVTYGVTYWPLDGESVEIDTDNTFVKYSTVKTAARPADDTFELLSPPSLSQGDYLWCLSQVKYVGIDTPLKSYSVSRVGTDGDDGDPGSDGYTTHFAYAKLKSGQSIPANGKLTTAMVDQWARSNFAGADAIGTYRDQTGTDSTNISSYTWTKWKGDKGDDGASVMAQYAPNSSPSSSQIHDTWQTGDIYMRTKSSSAGSWSDWHKIVGESGGETDYTFNISSVLATNNPSDPTIEPSPCGLLEWTDAPVATTSTYPYLWMRIVKKTWNASTQSYTSGTPTYVRITGKDGKDGKDGNNAQYIYLKGTARDTDSEILTTINPEVSINGGSNLATNLRGLNLVTINRQTLALVESINYDTYGEAVSESGKTGLTDLYAKLNALDNSVFVCLVSHDAIGWNSNLITMLQSYGMGDLPYTDAGRYPFLFIGYKNLGKGNGLTRMRGAGNYYDVVELSAYVANGALTLKDGKDGKDGTDGRDGTDGKDGTDGADGYSVTLTPSTIIINQSEDEDGNHDFPLLLNDAYTIIDVKKGNAPVDADNISVTSDGKATVSKYWSKATSGTWSYDNSLSTGQFKIKISSVLKQNSGNDKYAGSDGNQYYNYYREGRIILNVTPAGSSNAITLYLDFKCNLQGTLKTTIKGDVETTVAEKITYGYDHETGSVGSLQAVGKYIRSSEKNIARLTETVTNNSIVNEKNMFGFTKGISYDGAVPFVQGYGFVATYNNSQQYGRIYNIKLNDGAGYYVVSCEVKVQTAGKIRLRLGDWDPVSGSGLEADENVLKVPATTSWQKVVAVFNLTAAQAADSNGALVIRGGSSSNYVFIRYLQIERGSTPSLFGICADDAANNSEPMHVTWNQSPSSGMFSDETSGNYGPGGTSNYTTNDVYPKSNPQYPAGTGYIELIKGDLVMTEGVYTLSFWARANANGSVMECFCYDATNTETYKGVVAYCDGLGTYYGELDPNQTEGMSYWGSTRIKLTTAWKKYYVHWYMTGASSKISVIPIRINGADTEGAPIDYYIAQIKLERGYVTSANRTVYETVMKQTARRMDFSVLVNSMEKAGIHLYTESNGTPDNEAELAKGIIDLVANKVNFKMPDGSPNAKISIDAQTGKLTAVDGEFSGTMTAAGGAMYFGKDGSWTGMATPSSVGDAVSIGVVKFNNGASYMGKVSLRGNGTYGGYIDMFAGGESTGSTLKMSHSVPLGTERSKIVLASGDNNSEASLTIQQSSASGASTVIEPDKITTTTVEANYILAKAGYKIQTADILTVSSSGSISASYQMIIVNTDSDITLTLSSDGASAGQLMIIKKTTNNGWVTVNKSGGTQIGKFNCGSLVCVYNSGWQ